MSSSSLHHELKQLIVDALRLEDVDPASIGDTDELFGSGLNLDSIDGLELATAVGRKYDVKISVESRDALRSVSHLAAFITAQRGTPDPA